MRCEDGNEGSAIDRDGGIARGSVDLLHALVHVAKAGVAALVAGLFLVKDRNQVEVVRYAEEFEIRVVADAAGILLIVLAALELFDAAG